MSKTSIKVQYVNQPKSPKGPGSVKTDTGVYYKVWKDLLPQFESGKTYEIEFDTEQYNGSDRFIARKILSSSESVASPVSNNSYARNGSNGSGSTDKQILWQVCLKAAAQVFTGTAVEAASVINLANELFVTEPAQVEAAPVEQEVEL